METWTTRSVSWLVTASSYPISAYVKFDCFVLMCITLRWHVCHFVARSPTFGNYFGGLWGLFGFSQSWIMQQHLHNWLPYSSPLTAAFFVNKKTAPSSPLFSFYSFVVNDFHSFAMLNLKFCLSSLNNFPVIGPNIWIFYSFWYPCHFFACIITAYQNLAFFVQDWFPFTSLISCSSPFPRL